MNQVTAVPHGESPVDYVAVPRGEWESMKREVSEAVSILRALTVKPAIESAITVAQAMAITGHRLQNSFFQWAVANKLHSCGRGRYLSSQVEHAMRYAAARRAVK